MTRATYKRFRVTDYRQIRTGDYLNSWQVNGRTVCEVSRPIVVQEEAPPAPPTTHALDALIVFACVLGIGAVVMLVAFVLAGGAQ